MAKRSKSTFYTKRRYWYHLSQKLVQKGIFTLEPWGEDLALHRDHLNEPSGIRIPVAPTIPQCLTALPQAIDDIHIYRTVNKIKAKEPTGIFDMEITKEGWLTRPIKFVYIGTIDLYEMGERYGCQVWPEDAGAGAGSDDDAVLTSREALEDWRKLMPRIRRFTKYETHN